MASRVQVLSDEDGTLYFALRTGDDGEHMGAPIRVDVILSGRRDVGLKSDLLKRALGVKSGQKFSVLDVTAGLLRDSVHLAQLGGRVTALEKHPQVFQVAQAALEKSSFRDVIGLLNVDARAYLETSPTFDFIYMDPMYPEKKKDALSGKESQLLQILVGEPASGEVEDLLEAALQAAPKRVVVKRPPWAAPVMPERRSHFIEGKAVRFDVY